jgi:hypothetical protein
MIRLPGHRCRVVCAVLASLLAIASCGGSDAATTDVSDRDDGSTAAEASGSESESESADGTSVPTEQPGEPEIIETIPDAAPGEVRDLTSRHVIDRTAHYAGFDIDIEQVLIGFDLAGFAVAQVDAALTNGSTSSGRLDTLIVLESSGVTASVDRDNTPDVGAGATASGNWSLRLPPSFDAANAVLYIGRTDRVRVEVPLADPAVAVTLEPVVIADAGTAESDLAAIRLSRVTVAADTADPRAQSEPGSRFLVIDYELTSTEATAISDDVWMLNLPSGVTIAPVGASIASVDAEVPTEGLTVTFVVDEPVAGEYVLRYTERFGKGDLELTFGIS